MAPVDNDWPSPWIENVANGETVYTRLLLVTGRAGPANAQFDGRIHVDVHYESGELDFAPQSWPVVDSYFKALVPLSRGQNTVRFLFEPPNSLTGHDQGTTITIRYEPLAANPPLHLVILTAANSPLTIDCPPERRAHHGHLDAVVAKMQTWAYMCQAFTADQCYRNGLGRRAFALAEQEGPDCLEASPPYNRRRAPIVHVIRSTHTLREFRDPDNTQQYKNAKRAGAMHEFATEALRSPSAPPVFHSPQGAYVAVLTLDSHWDPKQRLLLGHAALGAGGSMGPGCKVAVFGSHSCWSWPRCLSEVVPSFMDCSDVDENYVVNDLGNIGTTWETLNVGHGAFLHEAGHALNNPHHATGIMARGYHEWNRSFMPCEGHSKRTQTSGCRPITTQIDCKENHWNRMSLLRLRYHPTLRLPNDPPIPYRFTGVAPSFMVTGDGVAVNAPVGLGSLEIQVDDRYVSHMEWPFYGEKADPPPQSLLLTTAKIADLAKVDPASHKISISAVGTDQRQAEIEDYSALLRGSRLVIQTSPEGPAPPVPTSGPASKLKRGLEKFANKHGGQGIGASLASGSGEKHAGLGQMQVIKGIPVGQEKRENMSTVILNSHQGSRPKLVKVEIVSGLALDGFKLFWADGSRQTIGPCGGGGSKTFKIDPPSRLVKLVVRSGAWLDAMSIVHENGETGLCGGSGGDIRILGTSSLGTSL